MTKLLVAGIAVAIAAVAVRGQVDTAPLVFEVASVKPNASIDGKIGVRMSPSGQVTLTRFSLRDLIWMTYGGLSGADIQGPDQIVGGPTWMATDHFDIEAKADGPLVDAQGRSIQNRLTRMLKALIDDRFRVMVHIEKRPVQTYVLVLANKNGSLGTRIHPTAHDCPQEARCGFRLEGNSFVGQGVTMQEIARSFANRSVVNRPVRDGTGLAGRYDFDVQFTPAANAAASDAPSSAEFNGELLRTAEE